MWIDVDDVSVGTVGYLFEGTEGYYLTTNPLTFHGPKGTHVTTWGVWRVKKLSKNGAWIVRVRGNELDVFLENRYSRKLRNK